MEAFIHVEDVSRAITTILKSKQSKVNGQVFNIVGENFKIKDIGNIINKKFPKAEIKYEKKSKDLRDYKVVQKKQKKLYLLKQKKE